MAATRFFVSCPVTTAVARITAHINESVSALSIGRHQIDKDGAVCVALVFEKYYHRVDNRLTLTVIIDDFLGKTRVYAVGGGGGNGIFFRFDWGAGKRFSNAPADALREYII